MVEHLEKTHPGNADKVSADASKWSNTHLFAIDKDSVSVRLSKAYLSLLGDGSTHVFKADAIRPAHWPAKVKAAIADGSFDVIVTNPPFGTKLKVPTEVGREEQYELSRVWSSGPEGTHPTDEYAERDLGLVFLERSIRLLADGGKLAIVLPDTYLFSPSCAWLVQWLARYTITHSINVPIQAFEPHCRAKTTVIVLKKTKPSGSHQVIGSVCDTFGEDQLGRPRYKLVDGVASTERDDEMGDTAKLLRAANRPQEQKLYFRFSQAEAIKRGVLVASYWWRKPYLDALTAFAEENHCELVSVGDLMGAGEITVTDGHGSPHGHFKGRGDVPYVKVSDIKNWRLNENPKYFIPDAEANRLRRDRPLKPYDLVTPTRCTRNIGLFGFVMPWQTHVVLTREIAVWRVPEGAQRVDPYLLLALMSLKVVNDQFKYLVLMQMNREDLGERYREVLLPIPKNKRREQWSQPIRNFFTAQVNARESYTALATHLDPNLFADRP